MKQSASGIAEFENPLHGFRAVAKRTADLVFGSLLLAAAALPMAVIAAAIKVTSRGPVFFRQRRYGLDGRQILVWKFRTMKCCDNGTSVRQATKDDDRVTNVGRLLRRTSLDELPQLLNVVEGAMSLVGPRPHANAHNEQYRSLIDGYMLRHKVKPDRLSRSMLDFTALMAKASKQGWALVALDCAVDTTAPAGEAMAKTAGVVLNQRNAY